MFKLLTIKYKCTRKTLTTVGLLLIRFVLAVGHAITGQAVVNAVAISALKVIHTST